MQLSPNRNAGVVSVSWYDKEALLCDGSEYCFEEVRARRYFMKRQEHMAEKQQQEEQRKKRVEDPEEADSSRQATQRHSDFPPQTFSRSRPSNRPSGRLSLGLRLHVEAAFTRGFSAPAEPLSSERTAPEPTAETEEKPDADLSHLTPNNSLGFVQATPSRALPSPTVNTQEALGVIMDMFQAPTFMEDPCCSSAHMANDELPAPAAPPTAAAAPFTIFQDIDDKENFSAAAPVEQLRTARGLMEKNLAKAENETLPELMPDESTMWGVNLNTLAACPNSTSDFAQQARFVSTPFAFKSHSSSFYPEHETGCDPVDSEAYLRRQTKKLSPIMELSPPDGKAPESSQLAAQLGTIVSEHCLTGSSLTMVQPPPPTVLSFRDQTDSSRSAGPGWEVYASPERPDTPPRPEEPGSRREAEDVPMSPESAPGPGWMTLGSPEPAAAEPDLDAFISPRKASHSPEVPMSPGQPPVSTDVPMSPEPRPLVSDPWNDLLISKLLASLSPPLTSHPRCTTWQRKLPAIGPKTTITMGKDSLRVDGVLGEGAFAIVYQASDPATSEKKVLKVQKPANPWEFYIHSQLELRLPARLRPLFSSVHSAHLFQDGSILLGELQNYGTLLNVVNMYRSLGGGMMPQPLVLYFAACILYTVEQLHAVHIVHADVKPDNFMLGERFLDGSGFSTDSPDHGLVLIDLGQSIDMRLFPQCTAFTARCLTSGFQCTEMLSGRPWNYQTDYFGVAATVHCLLFGSYMKISNENGVWKTNGVFRRNPHADLWLDFFHTLLNIKDCDSLPSLPSLRRRLTSTLEQNYGSKLSALKSRLVVLLLENHRTKVR